MAKSSTTLQKGDNLPGRGRSKRTLILEAIKASSQISLSEDASSEDAEKAFFKKLVDTALDCDDSNSGLCLRLITERGWSALKPTSECVNFTFNETSTPEVMAGQVMKAVSDALIPPDLGLAFLGGIRSMVDIEVNTELKARIEKLEQMLNA